jgi:hypothetical protein
MKNSVFWNIQSYSLVKADISEEHIISMYRVKDGGDVFLQNIDFLQTTHLVWTETHKLVTCGSTQS